MSSRKARGTLVYSPDIRVFIRSFSTGKIREVSNDVESWSMSRRTSAISDFTAKLDNVRGKYNHVTEVQDTITVFLRRLNYLQCFTGYVSLSPVEQALPGLVSLKAQCTLKKIEFTYWDPYTPKAQAHFPNMGIQGPNNTFLNSNNFEDGGTALAYLS